MKITKVDIFKRSVCFICILNCFGNILSQSCQDGRGGKTLMKWQELASFNTSDAILSTNTDLRTNLTSYLSKCLFTPQSDATSFGTCSALCVQDADCMAVFVESNAGSCDLCLATACDVDGNGNDYDVSKIMIAAESFVNFIDNGKQRHASVDMFI